MLPKDYLAYRLSGCFCTDYSDASRRGTEKKKTITFVTKKKEEMQ